MGSNKKKQRIKVVVPCLVDEDDSGTSANDHEKLGVKNEDLEELHVENEKQHANQNADHDELFVESEWEKWVQKDARKQ
jgi:phosphopantothenoylcysteine synthetase/decarboxylase